MTLQLTLSPSLVTKLRKRAKSSGTDESTLARMLLEDALRPEYDPTTDLTAEESEEIRRGVERGDADFEAGRVRSLADVIADKRERFGVFADPEWSMNSTSSLASQWRKLSYTPAQYNPSNSRS